MCCGNSHILATMCYYCANYDNEDFNSTQISCYDIKQLRECTGADMEICRNALKLAQNDFDKAIDIIRDCGYAVRVNCQQFIGCFR